MSLSMIISSHNAALVTHAATATTEVSDVTACLITCAAVTPHSVPYTAALASL
jgi:hypothetical protein